MSNKFQEAQNKLVIQATRVAGNYLLSKYGSAHINGEPKVELTSTVDPNSSAIVFNGSITCFASPGLLNQVGVNMTVNNNDIEVESENIQADINEALNAAAEHSDVVVASLDSFKLTDNGTKYLKLSHSALQDADLGIVGKNEYATSPNKSELLQGMVKDAMLETKISFTGEFKEPVIETPKREVTASEKAECKECGKEYSPKSPFNACPSCEKDIRKDEKSVKASWLTADLEVPTMDEEGNVLLAAIDETKEISTLGIKEDMPMARAADYLVQSAQAEEQTGMEAQLKVEHEAANALLSLLQGMGYGSAKIVESSRSKDGLDFMAAIDDAGSVKAVSIPVSVKEGKVVLPKKALVSTLISKGLDVKAKLAEQFDLDVLEKLAAIDEKMAFEVKEAEDILAEKTASVEKAAAGQKQPFFDSDDSTLTVQKHLLPNHEDMKVGDKFSDGTDSWELVNTDGQQNSTGEGDSSIWTMKKCQAPEHSKEEPKNKMPI